MKKFGSSVLTRLPPLLIILIGVFLFHPVFGFQYVWDDSLLFVDKISLLNEPLSWALVSEPVLFGTSYFRPLVFLSWYIEFQLWGQSSVVSHAINLVFYLANSLLVYVLARQLLSVSEPKAILKPLLAALFYACHPVLIESTAWVSGRFDLFATFFIFLTAVAFLSEKITVFAKTLIVPLATFCALMSKELGVVIPVVLFCLWMAKYGTGKPLFGAARQFVLNNSAILLFTVLALAVYFILRMDAIGSVYHREFNAFYISEAYFSDFLPFKAFLFYSYRVLLPFLAGGALHPYESYFTDPVSIVASMVLFVLVVGLFIWGALKNASSGCWVFGAGLICVSLVLHVIPLSIGENLGNDRFLTASLGFFAIAIAFPNYLGLFAYLKVREKLAKGLVFSVVSFWFFLVLLTHSSFLKVWNDEFSLWQESYRLYPNFGAAKYNYIYSALKTGRFELAEEKLMESLDGEGFEISEQALYADILVRKGNAEALLYLEGVLAAIPEFHKGELALDSVSLFNITPKQVGGIYSTYASALLIFEGDLDKATSANDIAAWYLEAGELSPVQYQRAAIEFLSGNYQQSADILNRVVRLRQNDKEVMGLFFWTLVSKYCGLDKSESSACDEYRNDGVEWEKVRAIINNGANKGK